MYTGHVQTKICITCAFFEGPRRIPTGGGFIQYEGGDGRCFRMNTVQGTHQISGGSCDKWEPWGPIKK